METSGNFYLGRIYDPGQRKTSADPLLYAPDDLTTHAVVVGMTGSGKTGLCIGMLEEAALNGLPALMIDPKGDITNLLLHFPDLQPQDFQPWVNPDEARRAGQTVEQAAQATAARWQKGLNDWGIPPERIQALKDAAHFAIYTPGSDTGIPVSILASLRAPVIDWEENRELLREQISSTVTAILGLVGLQDIDPVRSREHILLSNIFEYAWSRSKDLDLSELILQTQTPPFQKLGVFEVNTFFPEKDRFELAMLLNNILAAPAFQSWIEGQPLDIPHLLYAPDGRPRHSVFYIAHLPDAERMFFITLLFSAVESWMRAQSGTSTLRALLYFDEIFGYMPPLGNPPSKSPMLRMLKQARAFGVGLVLVTQNPVDLDYKGLSNAGTWLIGKLQTERDKQRLLDGLEGAMQGALDRAGADRIISGLDKRVFLLNNIHEKGPRLFQTRWAMNYLAGPLTRQQIPALNQLVGAEAAPAMAESAIPLAATTRPKPEGIPAVPAAAVASSSPARTVSQAASETLPFTQTRPAVPSGIDEFFLPNTQTLSEALEAAGRRPPSGAVRHELVYRPVILAQTSIRFFNRKYNLDLETRRAVLVDQFERRAIVRWEKFLADALEPGRLAPDAEAEARFAGLDSPVNDAKALNELKKDFLDWAYRESEVSVRANEELDVYAGPQISQAEFKTLCTEAARDKYEAELEKSIAPIDRKINALQERLKREERELETDQEELSQRKLEEFGTHAETLLSLFGGRRRRVSTSLTKRRMTGQARADVDESKDAIEDYKKELAALEEEKAQLSLEIKERWSEIVAQEKQILVRPLQKDVLLDLFGVAWMPYYLIQSESERFQLPAYH